MTTFNLPDLGEGLAEAEIVKWHVTVGETVKVDQPMVSVETAKAVVEVPSPYSGVIKALHAKAGDIVETGRPLVDFDIGAAAPAGAARPAEAARSRDSGTVVGSMPTSDEELIENATAGATSRAASGDRVRAAPAVRALAKKLGVNLNSVNGTGRGGLITVDDIMSSTSRMADPQGVAIAGTRAALTPGAVPVPAPAPTTPAGKAPPAPAASKPASAAKPDAGAEQLRGLRRSMAHTMSQSRDQVCSCTLFDDADLHGWLRKGDYTARVLRAIAVACREEPALNAHYDGDSMTRRTWERVDIAIAVDTPEGLIVPTIRDVSSKDARQLRAELQGLKEAARNRTVAPEALKDFTFILSNFGMIAGRYGTPVVVPPTVGILGAGGLRHDVVAVTGGIETHLRMPLSLSFDHRCVTGGEAARFLATVIKDLELPD